MSDGSQKFSVSRDGKLTAIDADIAGKITANSGRFSGWEIGDNMIYGTSTYTDYEGYVMLQGSGANDYSIFSIGKQATDDISNLWFSIAVDGGIRIGAHSDVDTLDDADPYLSLYRDSINIGNNCYGNIFNIGIAINLKETVTSLGGTWSFYTHNSDLIFAIDPNNGIQVNTIRDLSERSVFASKCMDGTTTPEFVFGWGAYNDGIRTGYWGGNDMFLRTKGDSIKIESVYNSTVHTNFTIGGSSWDDGGYSDTIQSYQNMMISTGKKKVDGKYKDGQYPLRFNASEFRFYGGSLYIANGSSYFASTENIKTNIAPTQNVLSLFTPENSSIYNYNLKSEVEKSNTNDETTSSDTTEITTNSQNTEIISDESNTHYGFVIGEGYNTPSEVLSSDGKYRSLFNGIH